MMRNKFMGGVGGWALLAAPLLVAGAAPARAADRQQEPQQQEPQQNNGQPSRGTQEPGTGAPADSQGARGKPALPSTPPNDTRAAGADNQVDNATPADLIGQLHAINQQEVELGKLAEQKAESRKVKQFARQMVKDHTAADKQLMDLATRKRLDRSQMDAAARQATQSQSTTVDQLKAASGAEFDRLFANAMQTGHAQAVELVSGSMDQVTDPDVRAALNRLLPTLKHHQKMAQDLMEQLQGKTSS